VAVHAFRRDELLAFDVVLGGDRTPCVKLAAAEASKGAKKLARPSR
jgi:hypothetical protein